MTIARILVIEDRKIERDTLERVAKAYGRVDMATNLEEAVAKIREHPPPNLILCDMHLHDGHTPLEVATAVYKTANLNATRLYFMTTDIGDTELVQTMRQHFHSIKLLEKSPAKIRELLDEMREDQSGRLVHTMDAGTKASHDSIRAIVREVIDELLVDLGITWFDVKTWVRARLRCVQLRDRMAWALGLLVLGGLVMAVAGFIGTAVLDAMREGLRP